MKMKSASLALLFCAAMSTNAYARFYDSAAGRFISPDSIVSDALDPQNLNRYAYVENNPLIYVDPSGHNLETVVRGLTMLFPTFAPSMSYNAWNNNVNNSQDFQRYGYQAAAWNAAIAGGAWAIVEAPAFASASLTESSLGTGDGKRFQERFGDEVFHDALGLDPQLSLFMSGLTLRAIGSMGLTAGINAYGSAGLERSMVFAEAQSDSVIDLGTIYWSRPAMMTSNQLAGLSMESVLGASNFAAGWGDRVSMGGTAHVRNWLNIQTVDRQSIAYGAGELAGMANEAGMAAAGLTSGIQRGGFLNNNPYIRLGYSWNAEKDGEVFRLAIGSKKLPFHLHQDFPWWIRSP